MGELIQVGNVTISAPCGSCSHEPVCAIKASLRGLEDAEVGIPKPDPALTVGLAVTVECTHFLRVGKAKGGTPGRKLNLTDADRQARGDRLRALNESKRSGASA